MDTAEPADVCGHDPLPPGPISVSVSDETALDLFLRALGASSELAARALLLKAGIAEDEIAAVAAFAVERVSRGVQPDAAKARLSGQQALLARLGVKTAEAVMAYCRTYVNPRRRIPTVQNDGSGLDQALVNGAAPSSIAPGVENYCPGGQAGLAPYCHDGCGPTKPCDKLCRADDETCITVPGARLCTCGLICCMPPRSGVAQA